MQFDFEGMVNHTGQNAFDGKACKHTMNKMNLFYTAYRQEWRDWLSHHFETENDVWFVFPMKGSGEAGGNFARVPGVLRTGGSPDEGISRKQDGNREMLTAKSRKKKKPTIRRSGRPWRV